MPYPKLVSQNYNNLGGVNEKASEYTTQRTQFLKLFNVDFRVPNALTKRDGSTQMISAGASFPITSLTEYIRTDGSSYIIFGSSGGIGQKIGAAVTQPITDATNYLGENQFSQYDYQTYNDQLWLANGSNHMGFNGSTFYAFAAPVEILTSAGVSVIGTGSSAGFYTAGFAFITYGYTYKKRNGSEIPSMYFENKVVGISSIVNTLTGRNTYTFGGIPSVGGASAILLEIGYPSVAIPKNGTPTLDQLDIEFINVYRGSGTSLPSVDEMTYIGQVPYGATRFIDTNGNTTFPQNNAYPNYQHPFYFTRNLGVAGFSSGMSLVYAPEFLEIYNNSLFMAGFTGNPSRLWFSEIGEPETVFPENFIDIRTGDGDIITGIKTYLDQHIIFKEKSFHRLIGDDSTNYSLSEVTNEYGALNNTCIVEAENILYFLDSKGIIKYNGTSWILQSFPIEDTINTINVSVAKDTAYAVHKKKDNQVWFAVPTGASTENNLVCVYDYVLDAWAFHDGLNVSSFAVMKGDLDQRKLQFGSYSGVIHYFDSSFKGDNGAGISCVVGGRYEAAQGQNVEKVFRRLFTDIKVDAAASTIIDVSGYKNYNGLTSVYSATLNQGTFQQKKDFGFSAKSMAFTFSHNSSVDGFQFNGYGVATRYLRDD